MSVDIEKLIAYADGELTREERAQVEAALAQDETLRTQLAAHQALRTRLSAAFDGTLHEPAPSALLAAAQAAKKTTIIDLAQRRASKWSMPEWSAMAASLALGVLAGAGFLNGPAPMIEATSHGLIAQAALAQALDTQLAADQPGAVRIGLSFRAKDGDYCRTFDLTRSGATGLACRDNGNWTIAATAAGTPGEMRMAGTSEQIMTAVETIIDGDPLDAAAERDARAAGWR